MPTTVKEQLNYERTVERDIKLRRLSDNYNKTKREVSKQTIRQRGRDVKMKFNQN